MGTFHSNFAQIIHTKRLKGGEAVRGTVLRFATGGAGAWHGEVEVEGGTLEKGIYGIGGNRPVPLAENKGFVATNVKTVRKQGTVALIVTDYTTIRSTRGAEKAKD